MAVRIFLCLMGIYLLTSGSLCSRRPSGRGRSNSAPLAGLAQGGAKSVVSRKSGRSNSAPLAGLAQGGAKSVVSSKSGRSKRAALAGFAKGVAKSVMSGMAGQAVQSGSGNQGILSMLPGLLQGGSGKSGGKSQGANVGQAVMEDVAQKAVAELLERNRQGEIFQSLSDHSEKFFDKAKKNDDERNVRLEKAMSNLGQRQDSFTKGGVELSIVPERGMDTGSMFLPPAWKITESYPNKSPEPIVHHHYPYGYPFGIGNSLINGCFKHGFMYSTLLPYDPCKLAMRRLKLCWNLLDAANFIGVGFDGRGDYSSSSSKNSVIQRTCNGMSMFGKYTVPDTMTVHGVYDTDTKSIAFQSVREYQSYLEDKAAVAQTRHMFQEATAKAYGRQSVGFLGLVGMGDSDGSFKKTASSQTSSRFDAESRKRQRSGTRKTFLSVFELNVVRYELFLDDLSFDDLNAEFLADFLDLPLSYVGTNPQKFQDFILRWGTHYIKSAKFGGQLKVAKTKTAEEGETIDSFATKAEADNEAMFSTFSAKSSQFQSSGIFHSGNYGQENTHSKYSVSRGFKSSSSQKMDLNWFRQEYSNQALMVEGGNQKIATILAEMYTTGFKRELADWLASIPEHPKPFDFQMSPITDLCRLNYKALFPNGTEDMGCFGKKVLQTEKETGRKYYVIRVQDNPDDDRNDTEYTEERRYCDYTSTKSFKQALRRRCNALTRAISVYLKEGPVPSTDIYLPPGDAACEDTKAGGILKWANMTDGSPFKVLFDAPLDIGGVGNKDEVLVVSFDKRSRKWSVRSKDGVSHLYDLYGNGGSNVTSGFKISVRGLVLDYNDKSGLLYLSEDSFGESRKVLPNLPESLSGLALAKVEKITKFHEIEEHKDQYGVGAIPCNVAWSNSHRFERFSRQDTCVFFTAASEGDIFIIFSVVPRDRTTWYYLQIGPQGVVIYKGTRVMKFISDAAARSLGDPLLYESYFVCLHEFADGSRLSIKYGKTADNGAESYVYAVYEDDDPLHVRFYAFGNGEAEATIMNVELFPGLAPGSQICLGGTVLEQGGCVEKCHSDCNGCHSPGSNSKCRRCRNFKYRQRCVDICPPMYEPSPHSRTCICSLKEGDRCVWTCSALRVRVRSESGRSHCQCRVRAENSDVCLRVCPSTTVPVQQNRGIICINNVRLVGGLTLTSGRVEVRTGKHWATVCDDHWRDTHAKVVCRQLGYCGGTATTRAAFGEGTGSVLMAYANCSGNESNLNQCVRSLSFSQCDHSEDAGAICKPCDLRLAGGNNARTRGVVEVKKDGTWGTVCRSGWDSREATVVCKQLGYCRGSPGSSYQYSWAVRDGPVFYGNLRCQGSELSLASCPRDISPGCSPGNYAQVRCYGETPCMR